MAHDKDDVERLSEDHPIVAMMEKFADSPDKEIPTIEEVFIAGAEDTVVSSDDIMADIAKMSMRCFDSDRIALDADSPHKAPHPELEVVAKSIDGSTQSKKELRDVDPDEDLGLSAIKVVPPPYPPEILSAFLEVEETHYRCVQTKVTDSVGREYKIEAVQSEDGTDHDPTQSNKETDKTAQQKAAAEEIGLIRNFIQDSHPIIGFEGVLSKACMDYESIGWGVVEIIRSRDGKVRKINHLPASRLRVLKGWKGFVEILSPTKFRYYQLFGNKIQVVDKEEPGGFRPYSPLTDGELDMSNSKIDWKMIHRETGKPTKDFNQSANEIVYIPKLHSNTIYYGMPDIVPALGHLLANVQIRDFLLQYFEHNTVPRYAVIIEGAKVADPVKRMIAEYFSTHVKGKPHKTLIIPVPALRGEVTVRFEKLDADQREGSFLETRKSGAQGIMTSHGVSPAIIGISESSELGSGKGLSQAEIYKDRIVSPCQRRWDGCINRLFRLGLGVKLVAMHHTPLDIRDRTAEKDILIAYVDKGLLSINQAKKRGQLGDAVEGGDRPFLNTTGGLIFLDEIDEMKSENIQAMEDEIEGLKQQSVMDKTMQGVKDEGANAAQGVKDKGAKAQASAKAQEGRRQGPTGGGAGKLGKPKPKKG